MLDELEFGSGLARTSAATAGRSCFRAVQPLVIELAEQRFVISSPRVSKRFRVGSSIVEMLLRARTFIDADDYPERDVSVLAAAGFLLDAAEPEPATPVPWDVWGTAAWSFYRRIRDSNHVLAMSDAYMERVRTQPGPSSVRAPASDRILLLPRVRTDLTMPFRAVLEGRRTHRDFQDRPLDLDRFSDMLHYGFAPLRFADAAELGTVQLRASASGGARHETEAFVFVLNVTNIDPGLYHYDNIRHGLVPVNQDAGRAELESLTHGQRLFENAAFGVLTVAVAARMAWKYPHPMAYRMLLHNVGHVAQVFSMTATAMGLGAALTGAVKDTEAERLLGLAGPGEFTTFALACGFPVLGADGMPPDIRPPARAPARY
jgi:SagB-type dehydrogenase family enzyme